MRIVRIASTFAWLAAIAPATAQELPPIEVESILLKLVEQVDVPAEQAGVLRQICVQEGDFVAVGQVLVQVDDEAAQLHRQKSEVEVQIALRLARDRLPVEIARKTLEQTHQKLQQLTLEDRMATRQAENVFRVEAADKAHLVAENELGRARKAKAAFDNAVSQSEIDGLQLQSEKSGLEAKQSRFEKEIDSLKAEAAKEGLRGQELAVGAAELEVAKAEAEHEVAQLQVSLKKREHDLASLDVARRRILAPIDGVVVELYHDRGEWVEPGQPVMRILRLNRLWAEGFIRVEDLSRCVEQAHVSLKVPVGKEDVELLEGKIVFIGREVDPVNREVLVRAEVDNADLKLLPGMDGAMVIHPRRVIDASQ